MAATVTLATTTLIADVSPGDTAVQVLSTSGILPGLRLCIDSELMTVVSLGVATSVNVLRGRDGTAAQFHDTPGLVTIGRGDQFYEQDPVGTPPAIVLVSPWINVRTGTQWTAQGDELGSGAGRWWQATVTTHDIGPLGVRTLTVTP